MDYFYGGFLVYSGTFTDGENAGKPWSSAQVLLGRMRVSSSGNKKVSSVITCKARPEVILDAYKAYNFVPGQLVTCSFDDTGRLVSIFPSDDADESD